jgi:hypothetical protein
MEALCNRNGLNMQNELWSSEEGLNFVGLKNGAKTLVHLHVEQKILIKCCSFF